jgi:hypothetical protein
MKTTIDKKKIKAEQLDKPASDLVKPKRETEKAFSCSLCGQHFTVDEIQFFPKHKCSPLKSLFYFKLFTSGDVLGWVGCIMLIESLAIKLHPIFEYLLIVGSLLLTKFIAYKIEQSGYKPMRLKNEKNKSK